MRSVMRTSGAYWNGKEIGIPGSDGIWNDLRHASLFLGVVAPYRKISS